MILLKPVPLYSTEQRYNLLLLILQNFVGSFTLKSLTVIIVFPFVLATISSLIVKLGSNISTFSNHLLISQEVVPKRVVQMEEAIKNRDFPAFAHLSCADSNQFHAVCLDTTPPIFYMNDTSHRHVHIFCFYLTWDFHLMVVP